MQKSLIFLISFLLCSSFSSQAQPSQTVVDGAANYQAGVNLLQRGEAADAFPYLEAAVKANRDSYLYRLNAGRAAQFSGNYQSCVDNMTEALRLRPKEQSAQAFHLWRGECYADLGDRMAAERDFAKAVELQPGLSLAYSVRIFKDTSNLCHGTADSKYLEANSNYGSNKIYEAYRDVNVALKCDPNHLPSLSLRVKIEASDSNLATNAKFHRVQLEKIKDSLDATRRPTTTSNNHGNGSSINLPGSLEKKVVSASKPATAELGKPKPKLEDVDDDSIDETSDRWLDKVLVAKAPAATASSSKPVENPNQVLGRPGEDTAEGFLARALDANVRRSENPNGVLLKRYYEQLDKYFEGQTKIMRTVPPKPVTGLYGAIFQRKEQLALDLIRQGADVNYYSVSNFGYRSSVLYEAVNKESLPLIKALLDAGANPNCDLALKENCTLGLAISKKNPLYVALLIRYGVNVSSLFNNDGMTHLMLASTDPQTEIRQLLIEAGADESPVNRWGENAAQIVARKKREAIAEAAKPPPTPTEQRAIDIKMIGLSINGLNSRTRKFNEHSDLLKKIGGGILHSDKISNLRTAISLLNDIVSSANEIDRLANRVLNNPTATETDRQYMHRTITGAIDAKNNAIKLIKATEDKIREQS